MVAVGILVALIVWTYLSERQRRAICEAAIAAVEARRPLLFAVDAATLRTPASRPATPHDTWIGRYANAAEAQRHAAGDSTVIGATVFVPLRPANASGTQVGVSEPSSRMAEAFVEPASRSADVSLTGELPPGDAAWAIVRPLQASLQYARWGLTPTWSNDTDWPAGLRTRQSEARMIVDRLDPRAGRERRAVGTALARNTGGGAAGRSGRRRPRAGRLRRRTRAGRSRVRGANAGRIAAGGSGPRLAGDRARDAVSV